jgi:RpiB/LacA/LacB family sugar-phosphate isomerase
VRIALGADHGGFLLKRQIRDLLVGQGHEVFDAGPDSAESVDYPDYASAVAGRVARAESERGILVCTTGVGMSIAANKVPGIRAALGVNPDEVRLVRAHNDANVLTIGARYTDLESAAEFVRLFLETPFEGGRHARRVEKITKLEADPK